MNQLLYNVCVVCYANYCRSPVAERLLQKKLGSKYKVISAGINPIYIGGMDKRSISYLEKKGLSNTLHTPKKINLNFYNEINGLNITKRFIKLINNI